MSVTVQRINGRTNVAVGRHYKVVEKDVGNGKVGLHVEGPGISQYWTKDRVRAEADCAQYNLAYVAGFEAGFRAAPEVRRAVRAARKGR